MNDNSGNEENGPIDWNSDDELEIAQTISVPVPSSSIVFDPDQQLRNMCSAESSTGCSSTSRLILHFQRMGFPEEVVIKTVEENGENNEEAILEALLTYSALEIFSEEEQKHISSGSSSSESEDTSIDNLWDYDSGPESEENSTESFEMDEALSVLIEMGYNTEEALAAIKICGLETPIAEIVEFIYAAQMAKNDVDCTFDEHIKENFPKVKKKRRLNPKVKKRRLNKNERRKNKRVSNQIDDDEYDDVLHLPNPMVGFGLPDQPMTTINRNLPNEVVGPPFFYFENVALAPKGVWNTISRFLYDVEPEFVDSKFFCAAARKRGYVHNLPIRNRAPLSPIPPYTIHEALPRTRKWWPNWDKRTKFNCILSCVGSGKLTERIKKSLEHWNEEPPQHVKKYVLEQCKKWNLIWLGMNKVAPLEPDEIEMLMGFPRDHTRGGGINRVERYKVLANAFQVDTVAYHLSVLKDLFPNGMNVLSLFTGIGGAEVALHRLGIQLNNVVSIEIAETCHNIFRSWWVQTNQKGNLVQVSDVQQVYADKLEEWIKMFGGFDLVIGGSPCNNLSGANRYTRDGIEGKDSSLFFEYFRILDMVKCMMKNRH